MEAIYVIIGFVVGFLECWFFVVRPRSARRFEEKVKKHEEFTKQVEDRIEAIHRRIVG